MRDGLFVILNSYDEINVLATGEDGREAIAEKFKPDLILMDIRMPVMDGVEATQVIKNKFPDIKVLLLTTFEDEESIIKGINSGASGYIYKDIEKLKLKEAILEAVAGKLMMPSKVASVLAKFATANFATKEETTKVEESNVKNIGKSLKLTERETEIALMLTKGYTNRQIASTLFISDGTVKNYVSMIYSKTNIKDRTKLLLFLKEKGIG
jgi:DNA-binding NarL/FixJ family response regulator